VRSVRSLYPSKNDHISRKFLFLFAINIFRALPTISFPENLKGRYHSEELRRWRMLEWILTEIGWEGVNWIHLAQGRDQWLAVVNTVMNFRVP